MKKENNPYATAAKEELWERGGELVQRAHPQCRGENILPQHSYHPWFYTQESGVDDRSAALIQGVAHAGLPTRGFYAIADTLLDKDVSPEFTEITWELIAREPKNVLNQGSFAPMLYGIFSRFLELSHEDIMAPRPHYPELEFCARNRGLASLGAAIWNAHYMQNHSQGKPLEIWPLILNRLGDDMALQGKSINAGAMEQVGTLLQERGELQGILSRAWEGDASNFLQLHDLIQEYNLEWALAAMDWSGKELHA